MRPLLGILDRTGRAVSPDDLARMRAAAADLRGRGAGHPHAGDPPGRCVLDPSPGPAPVGSRGDAGLVFAAHGRLDNRGELLRALLAPSERGEAVADVELIRRAYLHWGDAAPAHILGDWCFAAYHPDQDRLFVARDHYGTLGLFYAATAERFALASCLHPLLALPWVDRRLSRIKLAGSLVGWGLDDDRTFFEGIRVLPPAHTLEVTPRGTRVRRYWALEDTPERELGRERDYVEALLEVYGEAVRCRVAGPHPVGLTLSGGLDSGSIAALASRAIPPGERLRAYTWAPIVSDGHVTRGYLPDETGLAQATAERAGNIDLFRISTDQTDPITAVRRMVRIQAAPVVAPGNAACIADTFRAARDHGVGTMLGGDEGNVTVSWAGFPVRFGWRAALATHGLRGALGVLAPAWALDLYRRSRKPEIPWPLRVTPIHPEFAAEVRLFERIREDPSWAATFLPAASSREARLRALLPATSQVRTRAAAVGAAYGVWSTAPTLDKRVLEFCFSVPDRIFSGNGRQPRWLIREAMHGMLPDPVRLNPFRGRQASDLPARLRTHADKVDAALAELETDRDVCAVLDMRALRTAWTRARDPGVAEGGSLATAALLFGIQTGMFMASYSTSPTPRRDSSPLQ